MDSKKVFDSVRSDALKEYVSIHEQICVIDYVLHQMKDRLTKLTLKDTTLQADELKESILNMNGILRDFESNLNKQYETFLTSDEAKYIVDTSDLSSPPVSYGGNKYYLDDIGDIINHEVDKYVELIKERHKRFFM